MARLLSALIVSLFAIMLSPLLQVTNVGGAKAANDSPSNANFIPIPYAKVMQSSEYGPFNSFEPYFEQESKSKQGLPWPIHVTQELVTNSEGHISAPTMFGRNWVGFGNGWSANGFLGNTTELPIRDGKSGSATLYLERSGAIVGKVIDERGMPVPGAIVTSFNNGCSDYGYDVSGYDGTFIIQNFIVDCDYFVEAGVGHAVTQSYLNPERDRQQMVENTRENATANGIQDTTLLPLRFKNPVYTQDRPFNSTAVKIHAEKGKITYANITLPFLTVNDGPYASSISGRVVEDNGNPVLDATVRAVTEAFAPQTITDKSGHFTIVQLKPGNYSIEVEGLGRQYVSKNNYANVSVGSGQHIELPHDLMAERSSFIGGKMLLSDGTPLSGVWADITPIKLEGGYESYYPCRYCIAAGVSDLQFDRRGTDDNGQYFYAKNLPPGIYNVTLQDPEIRMPDKIIQIKPSSLLVDTRNNKVIEDADLTFNYTIKEDFSKQPHVRFFGYVRDGEGQPVKRGIINVKTNVVNGTRDFTAYSDYKGYYDLYILQRDPQYPYAIESDAKGLNWTIDVDAGSAATTNKQNIYLKETEDANAQIFFDQAVQTVNAGWGSENNLNFTLHKFVAKDLLTSKINIDVLGKPAKYSVPQKEYVVSAEYLGDHYPLNTKDVYISTNSTLIGVWLNTDKKSLIIDIDPVAGTSGIMDLTISKEMVPEITTLLFDSQARSNTAAADSIVKTNSTHTILSLSYYHDFSKLEIGATNVVPEFGPYLPAMVILAVLTASLTIFIRVFRSIQRLKSTRM